MHFLTLGAGKVMSHSPGLLLALSAVLSALPAAPVHPGSLVLFWSLLSEETHGNVERNRNINQTLEAAAAAHAACATFSLTDK